MPNELSHPTGAGRPVCAVCARPASACICRWVAVGGPVAHATEVLILQHPLEVANAKNSARLLHLCLPKSRLVVGEAFTDAASLYAPWRYAGDAEGADEANDANDAPAPHRLLLLYPESPLDQAEDLQPPPALDAAALRDPSTLRLVVLDATWRKSRKMLYASPPLQRLPRLALQAMPASRYTIRKAHKPDQLSTLEATCAALAQLEGQGAAARFQPLLDAFDGFVAQQAAYRP
ncbi:MAG: hypothetical protein JWP29_5167 [Rhodoferax sp.]|nr:hypothetical protein [Rhodoferax sp.]